MEQVIAGLVLLALVPLAWWLMLRGWRRRAASQSASLPAPRAVDDAAWIGETPQGPNGAAPVPTVPTVPTVTGTYVSTVLAGRPLERVTAHGLGSRSLVEVAVEPQQLVLRRPGAASFSIPATDLLGVHRARGQAGKVMFGKEDLVVITWRLGGPEGGAELETAVRTKPQQDAPRLVALVQRALPAQGPTGPTGPTGHEGSGEAA